MYQLILLDYSMPDMDGPDVAREVFRLIGEHNTEYASADQVSLEFQNGSDLENPPEGDCF